MFWFINRRPPGATRTAPPFPCTSLLRARGQQRDGESLVGERVGDRGQELGRDRVLERLAQLVGQQQAHGAGPYPGQRRSEEHTSELQPNAQLVCRPLLEKKNTHHNLEEPNLKLQRTNPK